MRVWLLVISFFSSSCATGDVNSADLCLGQNRSLSCLKENFDALYKKNYDLFFEILNESKKIAIKCDNFNKTADFLDLATVIKGNAEVSEFFSEALEKNLVGQKASCFLKALSFCSGDAQKSVVDQLSNPIFLTKAQLIQAIKRKKSEQRQSDLINRLLLNLDSPNVEQ